MGGKQSSCSSACPPALAFGLLRNGVILHARVFGRQRRGWGSGARGVVMSSHTWKAASWLQLWSFQEKPMRCLCMKPPELSHWLWCWLNWLTSSCTTSRNFLVQVPPNIPCPYVQFSCLWNYSICRTVVVFFYDSLYRSFEIWGVQYYLTGIGEIPKSWQCDVLL